MGYKISIMKCLWKASGKSCFMFPMLARLTLASIFLAGILLNGCARSPQAKQFNIVLISLDTVRADALGYAGNDHAETPNIDRLAREGFYFTQAVSTNSMTTPAHCSLLTGRYPIAHGVHNNGVFALPASEKTLAEFLKEHGYHTAAHVGAFPVSRRFGLAQGFDTYDDRTELPGKDKGDKFRMGAFAQRPAGAVADSAIQWMKKELPAGQPFFLFLHFFDPHAPYSPPQEFIQKFGTSKEQRYAGEIAYVDTQIGRILPIFNELGVLGNTIFIVIGDHGESLGEHGEETHGLFIYDSTIRIPMFFSGGPIPKGASSDEQIGLIDIFPTIADLLGHGIPEGVHGRSFKEILLKKKTHLEEVPYYIESFLSYESFGWSPLIGLRTSSQKLIRAPRPEFYDLKDDPREEKNIYQPDSGHLKKMENELSQVLQSCTEKKAGDRAALSGDELQQLRSLGYVAAGVKTGKQSQLIDPKDRVDVFRRMEAASLNIFQGKDVEASIAELEALEVEDPGNTTLQIITAQALASMGHEHEAEIRYRSLIMKYPDLTVAYNELASLLLKKELWREAMEWLQKSLAADPLQIELYSQIVFTLEKMDRSQEAVSLIDQALKEHPEEAILHMIRGELAFQVRDSATAFRHFAVALQRDPANSLIAQRYANSLLMSGRASDALKILEPFNRTSENDLDFQLLYAQCLAQTGDYNAALNRFERILARDDRPVIHYFIGVCLLKMGNTEEAKKHLEKVPPDDPNYEKGQQALKLYGKK